MIEVVPDSMLVIAYLAFTFNFGSHNLHGVSEYRAIINYKQIYQCFYNYYRPFVSSFNLITESTPL